MNKPLFCAPCLAACLLLAGPSLQAAEAAAAVDTLSTANVMRLFVGLVLVLAAIVLLSFLAKKLNMVPGQSSAVIRPLGSMSLSGKDRLMLVEVGDEQILIGISPGRISKVHTLKNPVEPFQPDRAGSGHNPDGQGGKRFANLLLSALSGQRS